MYPNVILDTGCTMKYFAFLYYNQHQVSRIQHRFYYLRLLAQSDNIDLFARFSTALRFENLVPFKNLFHGICKFLDIFPLENIEEFTDFVAKTPRA